jgi:hypothetical protein
MKNKIIADSSKEIIQLILSPKTDYKIRKEAVAALIAQNEVALLKKLRSDEDLDYELRFVILSALHSQKN